MSSATMESVAVFAFFLRSIDERCEVRAPVMMITVDSAPALLRVATVAESSVAGAAVCAVANVAPANSVTNARAEPARS